MKRTILIFCVVILSLALILGILVMSNPQLNDVSSDLTDPPTYPIISILPERASSSYEFPPANIELLKKAFPIDMGLDSMTVESEMKNKIRALMMKKGWEIVTSDPQAELIEAVVSTRLMRFKDDFVARVRPRPEGGSRVDFRSRSRVGKSDLGANAARILEFRTELAQD